MVSEADRFDGYSIRGPVSPIMVPVPVYFKSIHIGMAAITRRSVT